MAKKIDIDQLLKERLRELGTKGGKARMKDLSTAQRSALAKKAAEARWGKKKKKKT